MKITQDTIRAVRTTADKAVLATYDTMRNHQDHDNTDTWFALFGALYGLLLSAQNNDHARPREYCISLAAHALRFAVQHCQEEAEA